MQKLVRDRIPELATAGGHPIEYAEVKTGAVYFQLLKNKLIEETSEFLKSNNLDELVDIETVINAILEYADVDKEQFSKAYEEKAKERGEFKNRILAFLPDPVPPETKETPTENTETDN